MASTFVNAAYWLHTSGLKVANIDSTHFTHLLCGFADLDAMTNKVTFPKPKDRNSTQTSAEILAEFSNFTQLVRQKNPQVKTLLSVGGRGASNVPCQLAKMAAQPDERKSFIDSSIELARSNNFDGLDLYWEYPNTMEEMVNLGFLLNEWRGAVGRENSHSAGNAELVLSAATSYSPHFHRNFKPYPVQAISDSLNWINVIAYDFYTPNRGARNMTGPPGALLNHEIPELNGDAGIFLWKDAGVPAEKIVFGLPFYGYAWDLETSTDHVELFASATGPADGEGIARDGSIDYSKIVNFKTKYGVKGDYNPRFVTNYISSETTWIGYDDTESISEKAAWAKRNGLLGYFAWHVGADDRNWTLSQAASDAWKRA